MQTLGLDASAYALAEGWGWEPRRLDELLSPSSHLIVVYSPHSASSSWLPYVAGYSLGSDRPMVLYRPDEAPPVAVFLTPFFLISTSENLRSFLESERREWSIVSVHREARRELLELGVSFRGDSFAESVREGNVHAVDLFLRAGFPVDTRDRKGVPLLCLAVREGHKAVVATLLEHGVSLDLQSEDRGNSALMDAAAGGNDSLVQELLKHRPALDLRSKDGQTALVLAVGKNCLSVAQQLLEAGADPDLPDKLGLSARKYASLFHNAPMVELFSRYPAVVAQSPSIV